MRRIAPLVAALCLLSAGCGYVGDPLPPLANIPSPVTDLAAVQRGGRIVVHFTAPSRTTEGVLIHTSLDFDLRAGVATVQPFQQDVWAEQAQRFQGITVEQGTATCQFPSAPFAGKNVTISVRATSESGKTSQWSNFLNLAVVPVPAPPANIRAKAVPEGIRLTWDGPPGDFRVYRRGPDDPSTTRLADVHETGYTDASAEFGKPYVYVLQRIVRLAEGREAESDPSPDFSFTAKDTFPPAIPSGLRATAAPMSIELSWEGNAEPDLAGYRLYRAAGDGKYEKVAELQTVPSYSDRAVEAGKTYRYTVSAFDRAGNESAPSAPVEASK